ncbi:hypothetical protein D8Y22_20415 [Salinadaptatus halalkaliphilus]|uniref:Uncharacterized protein n=1 Tax=Salinadaptatus halalkaliphilus TaxID=2419781 RepID=A0A4S3TJR5_9EURY|nr:hypothetical protein [Salinadaptatus halalkaliphilus]THE62828.1 hypothetical protein D8Y22_20415 [Salinadaptatus halalkaliphilus]
MGILDLMLGRADQGKQGVEGHSYALPKDTHAFVSPVAVRRDEIEAMQTLLEAEATEPYLEERTDELQDAFDSVFEDHDIDATAFAERKQHVRRRTKPVIENWDEQVRAAVGVVYVTPDTYSTLRSFVEICRRRDEDEDDPFEQPESIAAMTPLLGRLEAATDDQYRAVVHTDLLPE